MSKYDIPYSMKPSKKEKKKKSKYSVYIEDNESGFLNRSLSSSGKKLIAYFIFFTIFAYVFITALRSSKHPDSVSYELDIGSTKGREKAMIEETITDLHNDEDDYDDVDVEVDEIDILDSDDGEIYLESAKSNDEIKSKKQAGKGKGKGKSKGSDDEFNKELNDIMASTKKNAKNSKKNDKKLNKKEKHDEIDDELIDDLDKLEDKKSKGRKKNTYKGENIK